MRDFDRLINVLQRWNDDSAGAGDSCGITVDEVEFARREAGILDNEKLAVIIHGKGEGFIDGVAICGGCSRRLVTWMIGARVQLPPVPLGRGGVGDESLIVEIPGVELRDWLEFYCAGDIGLPEGPLRYSMINTLEKLEIICYDYEDIPVARFCFCKRDNFCVSVGVAEAHD